MYLTETTYDESKLLLLIAEDSEYAFQLIYDQNRNLVYKIAVRYLKSPILAQEVVQDVFLKLWMERKGFQKIPHLKAWLCTVTKNLVLNHLKKIANEWKALSHYKLTNATIDTTLVESYDGKPYQELLNKSISLLPEKQRQVYILAKQESQSYLQIAEKLSLSPLTVKTHMARALESIRKHLKNDGAALLFIYFSFNF